MAFSNKEQRKIYSLLDEFVMATHGHGHAQLLEDRKAERYFVKRQADAVAGLQAVHPDAIMVLEPVARDEDTFMAIEAASYLCEYRPDVGLPLLEHLYETMPPGYDRAYLGVLLSQIEAKARRAAQEAGDGDEPQV